MFRLLKAVEPVRILLPHPTSLTDGSLGWMFWAGSPKERETGVSSARLRERTMLKTMSEIAREQILLIV